MSLLHLADFSHHVEEANKKEAQVNYASCREHWDGCLLTTLGTGKTRAGQQRYHKGSFKSKNEDNLEINTLVSVNVKQPHHLASCIDAGMHTRSLT